jgi:AmmeMemoRadiSam system protein A
MPMSLQQHNSFPAVTSSESNQSEGGKPATSAVPGHELAGGEFSREERRLLLHLAHDSISSALELRQLSLEAPTPHLAEPRGVFTSLYLCKHRPANLSGDLQRDLTEGDRCVLRGCVGYVLPRCSVYRAVAETARAAAFDDNRFSPVTLEEAPQLEIELSILSVPQAIRIDAIEVGRHGLLISQHGRRGLLLPQVPAERAWGRTTFLEQTCRKAGLPLDAWQKGATVEAFTAEIFGDKNGQ